MGFSFAALVFSGLLVLGFFGLVTWLLDCHPLIACVLLGVWVWLMAGAEFSGYY